MATAGAASSPAQAPACTHVASPGVDLERFVNALRPGDSACLRAGTYGARERRVAWRTSGTSSAPIVLRGHPDEAAPTVLGLFAFEGDHLTASGLLFDGPSGAARGAYAIPVWITGDHDELAASEVRQAESQGIYLDGADDARIVGNYIHDNGDRNDPAVANLHHGIYFKSGSGVIANNLIARNLSFGVHLYPSAHDVLVEHNTISGHSKAGVIIAGEPGEAVPARNRVLTNLISSNGERAITTFGPLGPGNVARGNVFWANGTAGSTRGLTLIGNPSPLIDVHIVPR